MNKRKDERIDTVIGILIGIYREREYMKTKDERFSKKSLFRISLIVLDNYVMFAQNDVCPNSQFVLIGH